MFRKVNVGIIGCGNIAGVMAATLKKMGSVRCYAVASRSLSKAQTFAEEWGAKVAYGSYEELVQDKKVDLVYIATPHSEHYANAMLCIKNKKAVLCEKAFMANRKQAEEVLTYAQSQKVLVAEAIWTRYMPMLKTIKEVLASGVIGEPVMLTGNLGYQMEQKERLNNPALAGGALLDVGVYALNFASMIFGNDVEKITSTCTYTASGVDRQSSFTLTYKNGKMAVLNCTMSGLSDRMGCIYGTNGYAIIENINNYESMTVYNNQYKKVGFYKKAKQISGYEYEVEACVKALKQGWLQCPQMPHDEILKMMEWMDELRKEWGVVYPFEVPENGLIENKEDIQDDISRDEISQVVQVDEEK